MVNYGKNGQAKLIFLDIDGTLCDYDGKIPASAKLAIKKARANGNFVFLNTGRSKGEMDTELLDIGFDGMICGNGNYVEYHQEVLMHQPLDLATETKIVTWLKHKRTAFYLESNHGLFASDDFKQKALPVVKAYVRGKGQKDVSQLTVDAVFPSMKYQSVIYRDDINKISFILTPQVTVAKVKAVFPQLEVGTWGGKDEQPLFGDLRPKGISKANAIRCLLTNLDKSISDTIAFGDAEIDIPMFNLCNLGVCLGNGGAKAKKAADFVTDSVTKDGLLHAFEHLKLI